jgi:acetyltransferase-like isoleucine patch superfamily enzyme
VIPSRNPFARATRLLQRGLLAPLAVIWLRCRIWVWGHWAFEYAVFHAPAWLSLAYLRAYGARIGHATDYHGRLNLHGTYSFAGKLSIGDQCHIGPGVTLDLTAPIRIADRATIALNATILTHTDAGYSPLADGPLRTQAAAVHIEQGAYIGCGATILMGVTIGACAVIAAGAVVTHDVPPHAVVAGIPARAMRPPDPATRPPAPEENRP